MKISDNLLKMLPKVELHCHLDGCLRINTILELAKQDNISLPSSNPADLKKILSIGRKRGTLEEYISRFDITLSVIYACFTNIFRPFNTSLTMFEFSYCKKI